jgi:hypothetical protein
MKVSKDDLTTYVKLDVLEPAVAKRGAHLLHWLAVNHPGKLISFDLAAGAIMGYTKVNKVDVDRLYRNRYGVRDILLDNYKLGMVFAHGVGFRATMDPGDSLTQVMLPQHKKLDNCINRIKRLEPLIKGADKYLNGEDKAKLKLVRARDKLLDDPLFSKLLLDPPKKK